MDKFKVMDPEGEPSGEAKAWEKVIIRLFTIVCVCICASLWILVGGLSIGLTYPSYNTPIDPICQHGILVNNSGLLTCNCYKELKVQLLHVVINCPVQLQRLYGNCLRISVDIFTSVNMYMVVAWLD